MPRMGESVSDWSIIVDKDLFGDERLSRSILFAAIEPVPMAKFMDQ